MTGLIVLDPGLSLTDFNHHCSFYTEITTASREMGIQCTVLASAWNQPPDSREIVPFFESDTYYFFDDLNDYRNREHQIRVSAAKDYARLEIRPGARILLPSASPWQLEALAGILHTTNDVQLAIGMIFPSSFWTKDLSLQQLFDEITWKAIDSLSHLEPFLYSETGFARRQGRQVALPTFLPMMSDATLRLCEELTDTDADINEHVVTFGFFGGLFEHKGVSLILEAAQYANLNRRQHRIKFCVPPQYQNRASDITSVTESIVFVASPLQNEEYLREMSTVTAVLCCYDPNFYINQMSGVVTEAAALGKPVIVSQETSLHRFLLHYAPGTAVPVERDPSTLAAILKLPYPYWIDKKRRSCASTRLVRELKSFRRFFGIALGY